MLVYPVKSVPSVSLWCNGMLSVRRRGQLSCSILVQCSRWSRSSSLSDTSLSQQTKPFPLLLYFKLTGITYDLHYDFTWLIKLILSIKVTLMAYKMCSSNHNSLLQPVLWSSLLYLCKWLTFLASKNNSHPLLQYIDRHLNYSWWYRQVSIVQPQIRVQFIQPFKIIKLDITFSVNEFQPISR